MLVIGLTGGIGCGKSLVSNLFHKLFSIPIIDADIITKQISQTKPVIDAIAKQLGSSYIDKNNHLKRKKLRKAIFSNPNLKNKLECIIHPLVYQEIKNQLNNLENEYCLVSIPLLLEKNRMEFLDRILVVDCTVEEQVTRVMQRDNCNRDHVEDIIASQMDRASRLNFANDVIENSGTIESLEEKIVSLHHKYLELSKP